MRILLFKHFSFDDEDAIASWANERGHSQTLVDPSAEDMLPDIDSFDLLVIMGGPMSVYQDRELPWLAREKKFVKEAAAAGKSILGLCLGGQMLADVLGGRVYRHEHKEIGFHEIRRTEAAHPLFDGMPETFRSYQWHGDAFDLPPGAVHLATSEACAHQAFAFGPAILGLQFHPEATPACIGTMLERWSDEIVKAPYIHSAERIKEQMAVTAEAHELLRGILDRFEALHRTR